MIESPRKEERKNAEQGQGEISRPGPSGTVREWTNLADKNLGIERAVNGTGRKQKNGAKEYYSKGQTK